MKNRVMKQRRNRVIEEKFIYLVEAFAAVAPSAIISVKV
jgi:hypothetical protein